MSTPGFERTDGDPRTGEQATIQPSDHHSLLAVARRQLALDVLAETTSAVDLETLASEIAVREVGRDDVAGATIDDVVADLHHVHLPKLADFGLLSYDPATRWIDPNEQSIDAIREQADDRRRT